MPDPSSHGHPSHGHDDYNQSYSSSMPTPTGQPGDYYNLDDPNYISPYGEESFMNGHQPNYSSYNYQQPSDTKPNPKPNLVYPDSYKYNKSSNDIYNPQQQHRSQQSSNHNQDNMHPSHPQNGKDSSPEHQSNYYSHYPYDQHNQPHPTENRDPKPIEEDYPGNGNQNINNYEMTNEIPIEPYQHLSTGENQQPSSYPYNTNQFSNGQSNHPDQSSMHSQENPSHQQSLHQDSNQPHPQQNQHPHQQQSYPDVNRYQHSHPESSSQDFNKQPTNQQNQHSHPQQSHPELNSNSPQTHTNQNHQNQQQPNVQPNQPSDPSRPREYPSVSAKIGDEMALIECPLGKENYNNQEQTETFWYKDGKNIESDRYKALSNGTLQIKNIEPGDHGMFGCMQRNNDRRQSVDGTTNGNYYPQVAYIPFEVNGKRLNDFFTCSLLLNDNYALIFWLKY